MEFSQMEFVSFFGYADRLVLEWKANVNIKVVIFNNSFLNVLVFSHPQHTPW